jgi:RNA polymerase sigma-70 factor (ECF subfamily)
MLLRKESTKEKEFTFIYQSNYKKLLLFCIKFVKSRELAEEIVQDSFITLWEKFDDINSKERISSYLYTIVNNRMVDSFRKMNSFEKVKAEVKHSMEESYDHIEAEITDKDYTNAINKAIELLPEKRKKIFVLSREENLSNDQIAEQLSISPFTVKNQLENAVKQLKYQLQLFMTF